MGSDLCYVEGYGLCSMLAVYIIHNIQYLMKGVVSRLRLLLVFSEFRRHFLYQFSMHMIAEKAAVISSLLD